jgi:hypothetical protein
MVFADGLPLYGLMGLADQRAELHASAMALSGLSHHAPISVERRGNCGWTDGCGSAARAVAQIRLPIMGILLFVPPFSPWNAANRAWVPPTVECPIS